MCVCNNRLAFALGMWFAVAGGLLLCIFANRYIPPYSHEGGFQQVTCTVENVITSGNFCCDATWKGMAACISVIPCYQIFVSYVPPGGSTNVSAILYENYRSYAYQLPSNNCSVYNCPSTFAETKVAADALLASRGTVGQSYPCYRNPDIATEALPYQTTAATVVLSTLIPGLAMIVGLFVCHFGYRGHFKYCQAEWEEDDDNDDEKGLFEKVSAKGSSADLQKGVVENGEIAQTDEAATDDTHVECVSLGSQSKLRGATDNRVTVGPPPPPAYNESVSFA